MQIKDYQNTAVKKLLSRSKELLAQSGEKKIIFKYKQKVPHRVKRGHRQKYTKINITDIK